MRVKICGITGLEQAKAIAQFGATDLGFICVPQSPRFVEVGLLAAIIRGLQAEGVDIGTVGVFVNRSPAEVSAVVHQSNLKTIQLHGGETLDDIKRLRQALPEIEIIKAVRVRSPQDLDLSQSYASHVDYLLLDAYHAHLYGGTGKTLDWETLGNFDPPCPWMLAGGLNPQNIQTALSLITPHGIDLSSGIEQAPGIKDLNLVRQLFAQLQQIPLPQRSLTQYKKA